MTAAWTRLKCQFGCPAYGKRYCCPPESPTPEQTRAIIGCYRRAILFHLEIPATGELPERLGRLRDFSKVLVTLEGEVFKDGYYKAIVMLSGACLLCKECAKLKDAPCTFREKVRPSMESCGIDVYQTARNNGFLVSPLRDMTQAQNHYFLMLVD